MHETLCSWSGAVVFLQEAPPSVDFHMPLETQPARKRDIGGAHRLIGEILNERN